MLQNRSEWIILIKNPTEKSITDRKNADVGIALQLDQIINTGEHVQSEDDTGHQKLDLYI